MREYEFTLRFALPHGVVQSDELIERLGDEGCDDALIGIGHPGRVSLEFARSASSAREAILSAMRDARCAIPNAQLIEVTPDLVGMTDVADIVGRSRQNVRKLMLGPSSKAPAPLHHGSSTLWHLSPVLQWLKKDKHYEVSDALLELSEATMRVNAAVDALMTDQDTQDEVRALLG